ncbi:MAG: hypothetical protein A2X08_09875 [Bacteroidetes bacterium GWA2_32_17]|nr:MAG: hypothetical protein A2X08_09875 [Bacteroidetes bacterium GWA2_32_17]
MKKINVLLLFVLIVRAATIAQTPFDPFNLMNEKWQKNLIGRSTLIIEGKIIKGNSLYDNNSRVGYYYGLCVIKPTAVLKGNTDTTKTYQILVKVGEYTFDIHDDTGQYGPGFNINPSDNRVSVPNSGIYFINENFALITISFRQEKSNGQLAAVDLYSLFPNAMMVGFNYGIQYDKKNLKDNVLKFLLDKHNLEVKPLQ